ncbi:uncharacterized protein LOC108736624 [Agrilus planipennis]|uniref:Uncharacterized protein LOC108736624 n=1 Tax=Agrilus planipennis TaxID=224129 RepID=A0A1W4WKZ9_AGRPL|nr:uncharacterized protein LOC108736624 [Agrilus planipennis]XP_018324612.1 uncharacterized protein LOC108736624 [Agrilus planipennis]
MSKAILIFLVIICISGILPGCHSKLRCSKARAKDDDSHEHHKVHSRNSDDHTHSRKKRELVATNDNEPSANIIDVDYSDLTDDAHDAGNRLKTRDNDDADADIDLERDYIYTQ